MTGQHIFAGNNTSHGFVNFFQSIFNPYRSEKIYILKGGSGVGKSSFIKKFAKKIESNHHDIEYIHCSSDEKSLDGIWIPYYKIGVLDGTAPHTIDPVIPGAVDIIINLGDYLDQRLLKNQKQDIINITKSKSSCYKSAYGYLEAAGILQLEYNRQMYQTIHQPAYEEFKKQLIERIFKQEVIESNGFSRKLFAQAYTPSGYIDYSSTLYNNKQVWALIGNSERIASDVLSDVVKKAQDHGYQVDEFFNPLLPDIRNHIYIYNLNLLITNTTQDSIEFHEKYYIDQYINPIEYDNNRLLQEQLLESGIQHLAKAKEYHSQLEDIYVHAMNFTAADQCFEHIISQWNQ